ncbi:MAG TPA: ComEA family DNA-binding protein, partial [Actinomycetota bacterium]
AGTMRASPSRDAAGRRASMDGFRDWLEGLTARELAVYGVVALALLVAGGAWVLRGRPSATPIQGPAPRAGPSPEAEGAPVIVHVAGMVRTPGVYQLAEGDRVIDAIEMAGGARRGAALEALNLAAVLTDGQQILVPKRGAAPDPAAPSAGGSSGSTSNLVNLNTADATTLETLPGIGEVLAQRIIEHREANGSFASVDDLISVSGIGEVTLEELRPLVTV